MEILLYKFEGSNDQFTSVTGLNDAYEGYEDWGIGYSFSYKFFSPSEGHLNSLMELSFVTKACKYSPAVMHSLMFPQNPNTLDLQLQMFKKDEKDEKAKLEYQGKMILHKCLITDTCFYYIQLDPEKMGGASPYCSWMATPQKVFDGHAKSTNEKIWGFSVAGQPWQKIVLQCYDFEHEIKTKNGNLALSSMRYLEEN